MTQTLFTPPAKPPQRLSVSAVRDFNRCGHYFKLGRIDKVPEDRVTHHRWAGSVLHAAFMLAYGTPVPPAPGERRTAWVVDNAGTIEDALELFEYLWDGERGPDQHELVGPSRAQAAFDVLALEEQLTPPDVNDFAKGQLKALKDPNPAKRREAYREYFRNMLTASLETGLAYEVVALEHEVRYEMGGVEELGYIDIIMRRPDGGLVFADLKTGSRLPMDRELMFDDQMNQYHETRYEGRKPDEVWYVHMKSGTIMQAPRNERFIQALHETVPLVMEQIQEGRFTKKLGPDCAACSRRQSCMGF